MEKENKEIIPDKLISPASDYSQKENESTKKSEKKSKQSLKKEDFKTKKCKVISYNHKTGVLDILFDSYGLRLKGIKEFRGTFAMVKYNGEIGKPGFEIKL